MKLLPIIIACSVGLSLCLCYLIYQIVVANKQKKTSRVLSKEDKYEYVDEYEEGDCLTINLKKY